MANPEHFYKYVDSGTAKIILKNSTLRWSAPSRFNDPFDVQFDLHIEYERSKIVEGALDEMWAIYAQKKEIVVANALGAVLKTLSLKPSIIPRDEFVGHLRLGLEGSLKRLEETLPDLQSTLRKHLSPIQLLCLSQTHANILMWSHYAKNHTGVVLRLSCAGYEDSPLLMAREVQYRTEMPLLFDHSRLLKYLTGQAALNAQTMTSVALLTKANDWAYEQEWRVVYHGREPVAFSDDKFEPRQFTAVYFGCRTSEQDRKEISSLASVANPNIEMFNAKKSDREFKLVFEQIA
jgi:Protein of unknown function (DUF2971)